MQRVRRGARACAAGTVVLLAAACTAEGPAPAPTPSAAPSPSPIDRATSATGVVLAPPSGGFGALTSAALRAESPVGVRLLEPPTEAFRRDLLVLLADERTGLVCTVGSAGVDEVIALAPGFPTTRFCVLDAAVPEPPVNVVAVTWPLEEGAALAGELAARVTPTGPIAVVAPRTIGDRETVRAAVERGARRVRPGVTVRVVAGLPGRERARTVIPFGDPGFVAEVVRAAGRSGRRVIGLGADPREFVDERSAGAVAGAVTRDLSAGLEAAANAEGAVTLPWRSSPAGDGAVARPS